MNPQLIISLIAFLVSEVPVAEAEILKIQAMLQQTPNTAAALQSLLGDATTADDATTASVNQWLVSKGFEPISL